MVVAARDPGVSATAPEAPGPAETSDQDAADRLGAQLVRLLRATGKRTRLSKSGPDGLEHMAYAMLFCLVHDGPQRTGKLAEMMHAEISTISKQTRSLVAHGLVERGADPVDGRACVLTPTAEGVRVFEENRRLRNRELAALTADWPAQDRSTLTDLLELLVDGLEKNLVDENVSLPTLATSDSK